MIEKDAHFANAMSKTSPIDDITQQLDNLSLEELFEVRAKVNALIRKKLPLSDKDQGSELIDFVGEIPSSDRAFRDSIFAVRARRRIFYSPMPLKSTLIAIDGLDSISYPL